MSDKEFWTGVLFGMIIFAISLVITIKIVDIKNTYLYEQGQIDAINGKIHYHLVKQKDGSTQWEPINGND